MFMILNVSIKLLSIFSKQIFDEESRRRMGPSTTWSSQHEGKEGTDELLYSVSEIKISDVDHLRHRSHRNAIVKFHRSGTQNKGSFIIYGGVSTEEKWHGQKEFSVIKRMG